MKRSFLLIVIAVLAFSGIANSQTQTTISDILENVLTSVVTVSVEQTEETKQILGFRGQVADVAYEKILDLSDSKGSGSGFIIDKNGKKYVVTNAHVIEDAAETSGSIFVYTINRTKYEVKVVGGDSFYDIAVLEFVKTPGSEIKPIAFAPKEVQLAESVYAIGNPLGEYPYTISEGIISAKNRVRGGLTGKFGFLQTTATVIWGNSGGPLVNTKGQVVGVNSQIAFAKVGYESIWQPQINFALEGQLTNRLVNDIINNNGMVKRAYLGIELTQQYDYNEYSRVTSDGWELKDSLPIITGIIPGSPAEELLKDKIGYSIVKIGKTDIRNLEEALGEFELLKPGQVVSLTLKKNQETEVISITSLELKPEHNQAIAYYAFEKNSTMKLSVLDEKVYVTFSAEFLATEMGENETATKGVKMRGQDINAGTWEVTAAGYDDDDYASMWRVKSMSGLGAALRLTATLGVLDIYLIRKDGRAEDMQQKRLSFSDDDDNIWMNRLWY